MKMIALPTAPPVKPPESVAKVADGGPTQPEAKGFHAANDANLVDLFSGNFSYTIPLMSVDGYPVTLGYNSGVTMDEEASWVGLGWSLTPGAITRNMRGMPDEFDGTDSLQKTMNMKINKTIGVTAGVGIETYGREAKVGVGLGVFHNTYKGWGMQESINANVSLGSAGMGAFSGGLSLANNSQEGITTGATLGYNLRAKENSSLYPFGSSLSLGTAYSSRGGMKALQVSGGLSSYADLKEEQKSASAGSAFSSDISFANPTFMPSMNVAYTTKGYTFTAKIGAEIKPLHPNASLTGYVSEQYIAPEDQRISLPAYGYLNAQRGNSDPKAVLDFNREKDVPYREKPAVPNIGMPYYTYDVFSITGEGTGGAFRAYRGDIGFVHDHQMRSRDKSLSGSVDLGVGDLGHIGADFNLTRANTESGAWVNENPLRKTVAFRESDKAFEAAYFRNPGEKAANAGNFYNAIGDDDLVAVKLFQTSQSDPLIVSTNLLKRYQEGVVTGEVLMDKNTYKQKRDKRTQTISYMTAGEASTAGLSKYVENYQENTFDLKNCTMTAPSLPADLKGYLVGEYYRGTNFKELIFTRKDPTVDFNKTGINAVRPTGWVPLSEHFSARWTGRLKVDVTGEYQIMTKSDDGVRLYINGDLVINNFTVHSSRTDIARLNLVAGQELDLKLEYYNDRDDMEIRLLWSYMGLPANPIPSANFVQPSNLDYFYGNEEQTLKRENRVNAFRKKNHISQIDVLNDDGRRYVYGQPVYSLAQHEATFAVVEGNADLATGLVTYNHGSDDGVNNEHYDQFYSAEDMPAYPHSFLLSGILTPDYVDLTGNGISDDDPGAAVKFNYTKIAGRDNPFKWRAPYNAKATYNQGLKTDIRDAKGSYISGQKELWYLHSIESKNMIATFKIAERDDMPSIDANGTLIPGSKLRRLDEINLYVKSDFLKNENPRPVKTVHFKYNYTLCKEVNGAGTPGKLTLERIWFTYNGNEKGKDNPYVFTYHDNNPNYTSQSVDRWGTYKPSTANPGGLSNADYPYAVQDGAQAANNAAAWTLTDIQMPSGGRMKVEYESDDYAYVQNKRAAQLFSVAGFSSSIPASLNSLSQNMYGLNDYLYVAINVPRPVSTNQEVHAFYLEGLKELYFRLLVKMPSDAFGSGSEFVSGYATLEPGTYGLINANTIWVKVKAIDEKGGMGNPGATISPFAKTAIQFLRLNLPSKAYPGSDIGDNPNLEGAIRMVFSASDNITTMLLGFDAVVRRRNWCKEIDPVRSMARLNNPYLKKYGGGVRVKSIKTYDNWNEMTGQAESVYGKQYDYTMTENVNGIPTVISSGVAAWEPMIGGEENPLRQPIPYAQAAAFLAPVSMGYTETPFGESLFPSPSVGYRRIAVKSIHTENRRSATGYEETKFFTSYDFPTISDHTTIDKDSKKRFKPLLANLLKIDARHFVAVSQGFKVELNDMNGKPRSHAVYGAGDKPATILYQEYFYHLDEPKSLTKHLNNKAMVMHPDGTIDPEASVGKDIELMLDMREERSLTNATSLNFNTDFFSIPFIPYVFLIPNLLNFAQREETKYRSVATTKVIDRHGLLDSVVVIDKGSKVVTRNLLYDAETGDVLLTATKNAFNDDIYNFTYPAGWMYEGMSGAYKNIGAIFKQIDVRGGKVIAGLSEADVLANFVGGDELLVGSREKVGGEDCDPAIATYPTMSKIYAVDANFLSGGTPDIYFMTEDGRPFSGDDVSMKIIRSGRRNMSAPVGQVSMMSSPLRYDQGTNKWSLVIDDDSKVLTASTVEYQQSWKVADKRKLEQLTNCVPVSYDAFAGGQPCGPKLFTNAEISKTFIKNDCPSGAPASQITYTVHAGTYGSYVNQKDADEKAWDDMVANGQDYANANGICGNIYYSEAVEKAVRNNCSTGLSGEEYIVNLPEGLYTSAISQEDADQQALDEAQRLANANGRCSVEAFVTYSCSNGNGGITVYLKNGPLPTDLTLMMGFAAEVNGLMKYAGSNNVMFSYPPGDEYFYTTVGDNYKPFLITIPQGQSSATSPVEWSQHQVGGGTLNKFPCFSGSTVLKTLYFGIAPGSNVYRVNIQRSPEEPIPYNVQNYNP